MGQPAVVGGSVSSVELASQDLLTVQSAANFSSASECYRTSGIS